MLKAWEDFKFGICFGMGFILAYALIRAIVAFLSGAQMPHL